MRPAGRSRTSAGSTSSGYKRAGERGGRLLLRCSLSVSAKLCPELGGHACAVRAAVFDAAKLGPVAKEGEEQEGKRKKGQLKLLGDQHHQQEEGGRHHGGHAQIARENNRGDTHEACRDTPDRAGHDHGGEDGGNALASLEVVPEGEDVPQRAAQASIGDGQGAQVGEEGMGEYCRKNGFEDVAG